MEKAKLLGQTLLFRGLGSTYLEKLAGIATEISFEKDKQVFTEGGAGDSLFVIEFGSVRVLKKGSEGYEEVARMGSGEHFGEMALVDSEPRRSGTVEALEHTQLLQIKRRDLEYLLAQDVGLASRVYEALARYLSDRLRLTTKALSSMMDITKQLRKFNYYPESW
jgi:CRP-like cAMP-binding protein